MLTTFQDLFEQLAIPSEVPPGKTAGQLRAEAERLKYIPRRNYDSKPGCGLSKSIPTPHRSQNVENAGGDGSCNGEAASSKRAEPQISECLPNDESSLLSPVCPPGVIDENTHEDSTLRPSEEKDDESWMGYIRWWIANPKFALTCAAIYVVLSLLVSGIAGAAIAAVFSPVLIAYYLCEQPFFAVAAAMGIVWMLGYIRKR